jgi:hypothetical protein
LNLLLGVCRRCPTTHGGDGYDKDRSTIKKVVTACTNPFQKDEKTLSISEKRRNSIGIPVLFHVNFLFYFYLEVKIVLTVKKIARTT